MAVKSVPPEDLRWPGEFLLEQVVDLGLLRPRSAPALDAAAVRRILEHSVPSNANAWNSDRTPRAGESICFVVSDQTRQTGADRILPVLVDLLQEGGCRPEDMHVVFATGIHRPPTVDEQRSIVGSECARLLGDRLHAHDPDDGDSLVKVGTTSSGHPVRINRRVAESQRIILVGAATYHYHAGFGGGRKSLVPGVADRETIAATHSLTLDPDRDRIHPRAAPGILDGNPVHEAMLEAASLRAPDIVVNSVLSPAGDIVGLACGDMVEAHLAACRRVDMLNRINLNQQADLVIASAGAAPNWVQSHKALVNASRATGPGGRIVLVAPCPEGLGNERFREWIKTPRLDDVFRALRKSPEILGQTALSTRMRGRHTTIVTRLNEQDLTDLGIDSAPDIETAVEAALAVLNTPAGRQPTCLRMPFARTTVPFMPSDG